MNWNLFYYKIHNKCLSHKNELEIIYTENALEIILL